jgi:hypothetical protein
MVTEFDEGLMTGLLISGGHFGGDGRQPQVTLRLHVRHEALLRWVDRSFPGGRLYGPYHHAGRDYMQWMARGTYLREGLVPFLERHLSPDLDGHSWDRFDRMRRTYAAQLGIPPAGAGKGGGESSATPPASRPAASELLPDQLSRRVEEAFTRLRNSGEHSPHDPES